jgi:uncharacterized protein DUF4388
VESGEVNDLSRVLVADEIGRVRNQGWSGVLALKQGEVSKGLYFQGGAIVFAASTVEEDRLGACLFRAGRISEPQFRHAMRAVEASGSPLGQVLVESHVLTPFELSGALAAQVERIVLSVLRWTSGTLRREAMDRPLPADQALDIDTNRLLLLGMRQFPDTDRLERSLGDPQRRLRRVSPWPFDYEQVNTSAAERAALELCARSTALAELLALPHPRAQLVRAVHALVSGGLIEDAPAAAVPPRNGEPLADSASSARPAGAEAEVPGSPEEAETLARSLLERGQRERALTLLRESAEAHPAARGLRRLLALTQARDSGFQGPIERQLLDLLEVDPHDNELRYALASYYRRAGMTARAILQLRIVLSADSAHAAAWRDLGELEAGPARRGR